jgi:peptidyl-prolyl cis-trans isomerase SurA
MGPKKIRVFALVVLLAVWSDRAAVSAQEVLDGIAAVVNGEVITFSQVRELVGARERALRDNYRGQELVEKIKETRTAALQDLIDRQLILQEFKKSSFSIPDYIVEDRIQTLIREEFGGDRRAFMRTLQAQGLTLSRFKEMEKEKIIVQAMRQKTLNSPFVVSPQSIEEYYAKHKGEYATPEQVKLRMIVLREDSTSVVGDPKTMAEEIRQKVKTGADFEKMAQLYSDDTSRDSGGDWGWIERNTLNETLSNTAFKLKRGQVSEVIQIEDSYYLLFTEDKKLATVKPLPEVREEIEKKLLQEERQKQQERWLQSLRRKAYIKTF